MADEPKFNVDHFIAYKVEKDFKKTAKVNDQLLDYHDIKNFSYKS